VVLLGVCHVEAESGVGIGRRIKVASHGDKVVTTCLILGATTFTELMIMIYSELGRSTGLLYLNTHLLLAQDIFQPHLQLVIKFIYDYWDAICRDHRPLYTAQSS
jgi:hypothetical protein